MHLGVLYPGSSAHPDIAINFMNGLKTLLKKIEMDQEVHVIAESVGFGGVEKEVYQKTEALLITHEIDALVVFVDLKVLAILQPLLQAYGKLVIVINAGANYPENWIAQPNIIFITLQHAFLSWLSGSLAAANNKKAALATSLYDCGYLHSAAMVKKFSKSGGSVSFNYVNKQSYDQNFHVNELTSYLSEDKTSDTLLCIFDSLPASFFYNRLSMFDDSGRLCLFVSPMMLEQKALQEIKGGFEFSITGYMPWLALLDNEANNSFNTYYSQQTNKTPDVFSLLGWETGLIIQEVFRHTKNYTDGEVIVSQLLNARIDSPRGTSKIDPVSHYLITPVIKCVVKNNGTTLDIKELKDIEEEWVSFLAEPVEGISSGWTNTYLCY